MSEHRTKRDHSFDKNQQQDFEVFPAKEFEFVFDMSSAFLPGTGSKHIKINTSFYFLPGLPGRSTLVFRTMFTKTQEASFTCS